MTYRYTVILEKDSEEGGYTVSVPALPGCVTEGDTIEEALAMAKEAIIGHLEIFGGRASRKCAKVGDVQKGAKPLSGGGLGVSPS